MSLEESLQNLTTNNKFNEAMIVALDRLATMTGVKFNDDFLETWIDFSREDVERGKFKPFEVAVATYKYAKYITGYPTYAKIYEVIRALRDEAPRIPPSHQLEKEATLTPAEREANKKKIASMIKDFSRRKKI